EAGPQRSPGDGRAHPRDAHAAVARVDFSLRLSSMHRDVLTFPLLALCAAGLASAQTPDWPKINSEFLRHYTAVVQMDTTDPPGNETKVAEYVKKVLEAEGIPVILSAKEPNRANLIARLKGNGSKRALLIMGHT